MAENGGSETHPTSPLLGTSDPKNIGNTRKSSLGRSPKSVCYTGLLHNRDQGSSPIRRKTTENSHAGCYTKLLHNRPVGLILREGRFYYRRRVPRDARRLIDRTEVWRSLRTDSFKIALRRLPRAMAQVEADIEQSRWMAGLSCDRTLFEPSRNDSGSSRRVILSAGSSCELPEAVIPKTSVTSFGDAYERYLTDPTKAWSARTREAYETSRRLAVSVIGKDLPLHSLSRMHCRDYVDVLRFLPRNAAKRFPKLTARQAAERARSRGDTNLISAANANACLTNLSTFLNWAVNEELLPRNPVRGLRLPEDRAKKDKRFPFSPVQLRSIFNAPLYRGCVDGERGYGRPGSHRPRNARFWVPLIGFHTGMRLNEICQLDLADVRVVEGVRCLVVTEASVTGTGDKNLKTVASERLMPIHQNLIDCGFLHFVEEQRRTKQAKLFAEIDPGTKGVRAVAFSKWFTQFLRGCGAYQPRTCFHSFRHNFRDELRSARVSHDVAMALGGWTSESGKRGASENYGNGHRVGTLNEAVASLTFSDIDISHLAWNAR
jgi:integrase